MANMIDFFHVYIWHPKLAMCYVQEAAHVSYIFRRLSL